MHVTSEIYICSLASHFLLYFLEINVHTTSQGAHLHRARRDEVLMASVQQVWQSLLFSHRVHWKVTLNKKDHRKSTSSGTILLNIKHLWFTQFGTNEAQSYSLSTPFESITEGITKLLKVLNTDRHSDPPWVPDAVQHLIFKCQVFRTHM